MENKTRTLLLLVTLAASVAGRADERNRPQILEPPISIAILEASYTRDQMSTSVVFQSSKTWGEAKRTAANEIDESTQKEVKGEIETRSHTALDTKFVFGVGGGGQITGHQELNTHGVFSRQNKREETRRRHQAMAEESERTAATWEQVSGSDWYLSLALQIKNNTPDELKFEPKADELDAYLNAKVTGVDGRVHYIKIPVKDKIVLKPYGSQTIYPSIKEQRASTRNMLLGLEILGSKFTSYSLKSSMEIVIDDNFPLCTCATQLVRNVNHRIRPIVVSVEFGAWKNQFPVRVSGLRAATYKEIFSSVNEYFKKGVSTEDVFLFADNGDLIEVSGRSIGIPDSNGEIVLINLDGEIRDRLSKEDLEKTPDRGVEASEVSFFIRKVVDIADEPNKYPKAVLDNCLKALKMKEGACLSGDDRYAVGVLHHYEGDCSNAIHYLSKLTLAEFSHLELTSGDKDNFYALAVMSGDDLAIRDMANELGRPSNVKNLFDGAITKDDPRVYQALVDVGFAYDDVVLDRISERGATNLLLWVLRRCPTHQREKKNINGVSAGGWFDNPDPTKWRPLMYAAVNGHLDACKILIEDDARVDEWLKKGDDWYDIMCDESYNKHPSTRNYIAAMREVRKIVDHRFREKELLSARPKVKIEDLRRWVDAGVSPDAYLGTWWSVFSWAVELGDDKFVEYLLKKGANPNASYAKTPEKKYTALMLAAEKGNKNLVNMLLDLAANVGSTDELTTRKEVLKAAASGLSIWTYALPEEWFASASEENKTAFCYAVDKKHYDIAMVLYKNGGVDEKAMLKHEAYKCNAYSYAALSITDDAGKPLLEEMFNDSNSRKKDENEMTPLMFASKSGNVLAVRSIRKSFGRDEKNWREYVNQTRSKGLLGRDKKSALDMAGSQEIKTLLQEDLTKQTRE